MKLASLCCILASLIATASAATITVPGDQPNIQAAVNASNPGDTILVSAGTYEDHSSVLSQRLRHDDLLARLLRPRG